MTLSFDVQPRQREGVCDTSLRFFVRKRLLWTIDFHLDFGG